jgi:hypothetical protein
MRLEGICMFFSHDRIRLNHHVSWPKHDKSPFFSTFLLVSPPPYLPWNPDLIDHQLHRSILLPEIVSWENAMVSQRDRCFLPYLCMHTLHYTTLHYTTLTLQYTTLHYINIHNIYIYTNIYIYAIYYFCGVQLFYRFFTVAMSHLLGWCHSLTDHVCGIPVGTCLAMVKSGPQLRWLLDHLKPGRHTFSGIGKTIPWPKTKNQHVICRPVGKFDPCPKYRSSNFLDHPFLGT